MTTVTLQVGGKVGVIHAVGHAGNRDLCIATTWALRTLAHVIAALGLLEDVAQVEDTSAPTFRIVYDVGCQHIVDEVLKMLGSLAESQPGHIRIERHDDVRHDGDGLRESA